MFKTCPKLRIRLYRFRNEYGRTLLRRLRLKSSLADFPQYVPEGNNGIAYYVDPGDLSGLFWTTSLYSLYGIGGRFIQDEVELGALWHISFG